MVIIPQNVECQICFEIKPNLKVCPLQNCDKIICNNCQKKITNGLCPFCKRKLPQSWCSVFKLCRKGTQYENTLHRNSHNILLMPFYFTIILFIVMVFLTIGNLIVCHIFPHMCPSLYDAMWFFRGLIGSVLLILLFCLLVIISKCVTSY